MTNSSFLKKLLATASVVAVTANAGSALANDARVTRGTPANQAGANLEQNLIPPAVAANVAVAAGSNLVTVPRRFSPGMKEAILFALDNGIAY